MLGPAIAEFVLFRPSPKAYIGWHSPSQLYLAIRTRGCAKVTPIALSLLVKDYVSFFYVHIQLATVRFNYLLIKIIEA